MSRSPGTVCRKSESFAGLTIRVVSHIQRHKYKCDVSTLRRLCVCARKSNRSYYINALHFLKFYKYDYGAWGFNSWFSISRSQFVSDGFGGSKKISLAAPSPKDELEEIILRKRLKIKKKPKRLTQSGSSSCKTLDPKFS